MVEEEEREGDMEGEEEVELSPCGGGGGGGGPEWMPFRCDEDIGDMELLLPVEFPPFGPPW